MSNGLNKVMIIGRLGQDPDQRSTGTGMAACTLSVATSSTWKDKQTGEKRERTEWHRVVAFGRLAEIMGQYLQKGSLVYIEGELQTRKWQDKDGQDKYTTEIMCRDMQMLGAKPERSSSGDDYSGPDQANGFDDDIPF